MAVTINSGLVDDNDILAAERVIDMAPQIAMLEQDMTQFTTLLMKIASRPAYSSIVHWLEDQLFPRRSTFSVSTSTAGSATVIVVNTSEGGYFKVDDVIKFTTTGEVCAVTAVSSDSVGVTRSIGSVAAASAQSTTEILILGNARAQGATLGTRAVTERVNQYNRVSDADLALSA